MLRQETRLLYVFRSGDGGGGSCEEGEDEIRWQRRQSNAAENEKRPPSHGREQGHCVQRKRRSYFPCLFFQGAPLGITLETTCTDAGPTASEVART